MIDLQSLLAALERAALGDRLFTAQPAPAGGGAGNTLSVTDIEEYYETHDDGGGAGPGLLQQTAAVTITLRADFAASSLAAAGERADRLRNIALAACRAEHAAQRIARYHIDSRKIDTERGSAPRHSAEVTFTARGR